MDTEMPIEQDLPVEVVFLGHIMAFSMISFLIIVGVAALWGGLAGYSIPIPCGPPITDNTREYSLKIQVALGLLLLFLAVSILWTAYQKNPQLFS